MQNEQAKQLLEEIAELSNDVNMAVQRRNPNNAEFDAYHEVRKTLSIMSEVVPYMNSSECNALIGVLSENMEKVVSSISALNFKSVDKFYEQIADAIKLAPGRTSDRAEILRTNSRSVFAQCYKVEDFCIQYLGQNSVKEALREQAVTMLNDQVAELDTTITETKKPVGTGAVYQAINEFLTIASIIKDTSNSMTELECLQLLDMLKQNNSAITDSILQGNIEVTSKFCTQVSCAIQYAVKSMPTRTEVEKIEKERAKAFCEKYLSLQAKGQQLC